VRTKEPPAPAPIVSKLDFIPAATAQSTIPDGTRAAPSISFGTDTGVGIYKSAPGHMAFATNAKREGLDNNYAISISDWNTLVVGADHQVISSSGEYESQHVIGHSMEIVSKADRARGAMGTRNKPGIIWAKFMDDDGSFPSNTQTEPDFWYTSYGPDENTPRSVRKGQQGMALLSTFDSGDGFRPDRWASTEIKAAASDAPGAVIKLGIVPGMVTINTMNNSGEIKNVIKFDYDSTVTVPNGKLIASKGLLVSGTDGKTLINFTNQVEGMNFASNTTTFHSATTNSLILVNSAAPSLSPQLANLQFIGYNSSNAQRTFARLVTLTNGMLTPGTECGRFQVAVIANGTLHTGLEVAGNSRGAGVMIPSNGARTNYGTGTLNMTGPLYVGDVPFCDESRNVSASAVSGTGSHTAMSETAIPTGGTMGAGYLFGSSPNFGIFFGCGSPTLSAAKGSLYVRSDGNKTNDRLYVNIDGSKGWTGVITDPDRSATRGKPRSSTKPKAKSSPRTKAKTLTGIKAKSTTATAKSRRRGARI
jgi:hypothetical protein